MLSRLEKAIVKRKKRLEADELIIYSDICNYITYRVTKVHSGSFDVVKIDDDGIESQQERNLEFLKLQHGWDFKGTGSRY